MNYTVRIDKDLDAIGDSGGSGGGKAETDTGSANAIVIDTETDTGYTLNEYWTIVPNATNSGATTINRDGLGVKDLKMFGGSNLASGVIVADKPIQVVYNGTYYVLMLSEGVLENEPVEFFPSITGFSVVPVAKYFYTQKDKEITVYIYAQTLGTSNATTYTIPLPFTNKNVAGTVLRGILGFGQNNSTIEGIGYYRIAANTNILQLFFNAPSGVWTASNMKGVTGQFTFLID